MTVIVDANIIISAIIKPESEIASLLLLNTKAELVIPDYALEEIKRHRSRICHERGVSSSFFTEMLSKITFRLLVFSTEMLSNETLLQAVALTSSIDPNDALYVSFSLELDALFWTGDLKLYRGLRRKGFNRVINTAEFKAILTAMS